MTKPKKDSKSANQSGAKIGDMKPESNPKGGVRTSPSGAILFEKKIDKSTP